MQIKGHCDLYVWPLKSNHFIFKSKWQLIKSWRNSLKSVSRYHIQETKNMRPPWGLTLNTQNLLSLSVIPSDHLCLIWKNYLDISWDMPVTCLKGHSDLRLPNSNLVIYESRWIVPDVLKHSQKREVTVTTVQNARPVWTARRLHAQELTLRAVRGTSASGVNQALDSFKQCKYWLTDT